MKQILTVLFGLFITLSVIGQIDRSQPPKPGSSPSINLKKPQSFELNNGLKVLVVENHKLPKVRMQLSIDNPPITEGDKKGVSRLFASLMGNGSKSISKDDFYEEVDFMGASISIGAQGGSANCLSKYFPRVLELMADTSINPNFLEEDLEKDRQKLLTNIKNVENDVGEIAAQVRTALGYGLNHPYGEIDTKETAERVTLADVEQFYRNNFVPANAYLVIIGDVDFETTKEMVIKYFTPWTKASPLALSYPQPTQAQYTQINFVDMPNAVQSEISVQNMVDLKMDSDDYFAGLLANYILGGSANSRLNMNLREDKGFTYGAYSGLLSNKYGAKRFYMQTSVRNAVTDSAIVAILEELDAIVNAKVTNEELRIAKAAFAGDFIMDLEKSETVAGYALRIQTHNLPEDYFRTYLDRLNKVTIADIQKAAKKYFLPNNARIVVTGKGSDVIEPLEKITFNGKSIPMLFYNKKAQQIEKPDYSAIVPKGITAKSVLEKCIEAIGGMENAKNLESLIVKAEAEMQGAQLILEQKQTSKLQSVQQIKMNGMPVFKRVFTKDSGYSFTQGQRKDLTAEEIEKAILDSAPITELELLKLASVSLEGIEPVGDKKAYKLKVSENKSAFYDVESGFLIQEIETEEVNGQPIQSVTAFDDYKEVGGIMFPHKLKRTIGPQILDFKIVEIAVNEGVSDSDFE